jgi:hypothetical protein
VAFTPFTPYSQEQLLSLMDTLLAEHNVPGVSLTIRNASDYISLSAGFAKTGMLMDDMTYCIGASLTKPLFAFVVLRLSEEKILDLSKPIAEQAKLVYYDHLPYYTEITPRHVLSHSSGLPNWGWNRPLEQKNKPGSQFEYSGEGFVLLQKAVEQLTGKSFWQLLQELLMIPAGIDRICLHHDDLLDQNVVIGHDDEGEELPPPDFEQDATTKARIDVRYNAAGSIIVQPEAYAKALYYIQISHAHIWLKMQTEFILYEPWKIGWGQGIGLQHSDLGKALWQWGSEKAFKNFTITFVGHDFAIHIFTNGGNGKAVYKEILKELTGEYPHYTQYEN